MKKLFILVVCLVLAVAVYASTATRSTKLRINGASTLPGDKVLMVADSSDTFVVDTFFSDTLTIDDTKDLLFWYVNRPAVSALCDSCNDSIVTTVNVWTSAVDENGLGYFKKKIATSTGLTLNNADATADSISGYLYITGSGASVDSIALDKLWFETIISDSVITDKAVTGSYISQTIHVFQR